MVGISKDLDAFRLMEYLYGPPKQPVKRYGPHAHCMDGVVLKPSTLIHVAEKFLQMAATNCVDAGHFNTHLVI